MTPAAAPEVLDLAAIEAKWLQQCGACDAGLPTACTHPAEDYRPVIAGLVAEIQRVRKLTEVPAVLLAPSAVIARYEKAAGRWHPMAHAR
jgi:hypothetical protein